MFENQNVVIRMPLIIIAVPAFILALLGLGSMLPVTAVFDAYRYLRYKYIMYNRHKVVTNPLYLRIIYQMSNRLHLDTLRHAA